MSFCPHRLLLSRLRAGSPSCFAGQRLRASYQQRRAIGARHFSGNVSQSNISIPDEIYDDLRISAGPHDLVSEVPTLAISATTDEHVAGSFTDTPRKISGGVAKSAANGDSETLLCRSPYGADANVLHKQIGKVHYYYYSRDGNRHVNVRNVSQELWEREMLVRSKSLYETPNAIHRWRLTCDEISKAKSHEGKSQTNPIKLELDQKDNALLEKLKADSKKAFSQGWRTLTKSEKVGHWQRLSLWLLYHSPGLVPDFLRITCQDQHKPVFVTVSDCIQYLSRFFPDLVDWSLIKDCLHPDTWPVLLLPQRPVRIYLEAADHDSLHYAWHLARRKRIHLAPPSILCFMKRFTDLGDVDKALEAIQMVQTLAHPAFPMDSEAINRHCCKLLRLDSVVDDGGERNFRILPKLLGLGIQPTRDLMNVVLSNAYKTGDSQVGQDILNYMKEQGLEPDSYTYLTLLTDAVRRRDSELLDSLLREVQIKEELSRNPWIISKTLHAQFVSITKGAEFDDPKAVFYSMLAMYNRFHDITPLKELSVVPHIYTPPAGSGDSPPSVVALYIIIASYLRCMKNVVSVEHVYSRFRHLVLQGHETITPLAATDHIYNEFLVAFRSDPRGLRPAVRLVESMLHPSSEDGLTKKMAKSGIEYARPSVLTWNILMSCFVFNKQPLAAEKVKAMMAKHGVECGIDTWNMIINNYANAQDIPGLARAIKQMELEGIAPDNYTLNPLRFLRDPERLWVDIDKLDEAAVQSSTAELSSQDKVGEKPDGVSLLDQGLQRFKDNAKVKT
ncbi:hypothetical protein BJX76DRAFT_325670 [Aspergillus varians]